VYNLQCRGIPVPVPNHPHHIGVRWCFIYILMTLMEVDGCESAAY
jgi:hypothetical protein